MGLDVGGKYNEVLDFLTALEVARKKTALGVDEEEEVAKGGERTALHWGEH